MSGVLAYADDRGRDGFAFQPIESRYLEVADDLRTPYVALSLMGSASIRVIAAWLDGRNRPAPVATLGTQKVEARSEHPFGISNHATSASLRPRDHDHTT
jgi:hypothetical protein